MTKPVRTIADDVQEVFMAECELKLFRCKLMSAAVIFGLVCVWVLSLLMAKATINKQRNDYQQRLHSGSVYDGCVAGCIKFKAFPNANECREQCKANIIVRE